MHQKHFQSSLLIGTYLDYLYLTFAMLVLDQQTVDSKLPTTVDWTEHCRNFVPHLMSNYMDYSHKSCTTLHCRRPVCMVAVSIDYCKLVQSFAQYSPVECDSSLDIDL